MNRISENISNRLFKIWLEKDSIANFEKWVYSSSELKDQLDSVSYYEFLSFNYKTPNAHTDLKKLIAQKITQSDLEKWNMLRNLLNVRDRNENCTESIRNFYSLYCKGYDFIDNLAFDFGLSLEDPYKLSSVNTFDELTKNQKENIVNNFYPEILSEINKVMDWIENGKIVLLGKSNEFGKLEYIDNRTESEKLRKDYAIKNTKKWWKFWK